MAGALLGWTPDVFWAATRRDFDMAYQAALLVRGLGPDSVGAPLSRAEMDALIEAAASDSQDRDDNRKQPDNMGTNA